MTQIQWQYLETMHAGMTADEKERLVTMLKQPAAAETSVQDPLLGAMADEPDLIDQIMDDVYYARENHPLRVSD